MKPEQLQQALNTALHRLPNRYRPPPRRSSPLPFNHAASLKPALTAASPVYHAAEALLSVWNAAKRFGTLGGDSLLRRQGR